LSSTHTSMLPVVSCTHTIIFPVLSSTHTSMLPVVSSTHTNMFPVLSSTQTSKLPVVSSTNTNMFPVLIFTHTSMLPVFSSIHKNMFPILSSVRTSILPVLSSTHKNMFPILSSTHTNMFTVLSSTHTSMLPVLSSTIRMCSCIEFHSYENATCIEFHSFPVLSSTHTIIFPVLSSTLTSVFPVFSMFTVSRSTHILSGLSITSIDPTKQLRELWSSVRGKEECSATTHVIVNDYLLPVGRGRDYNVDWSTDTSALIPACLCCRYWVCYGLKSKLQCWLKLGRFPPCRLRVHPVTAVASVGNRILCPNKCYASMRDAVAIYCCSVY
jgi:hypothetical protein